MDDFFISHTAVDEKWATWIRDVLVEAGRKVFLQRDNIGVGNNIAIQMHLGLEGSKKVIAVFSTAYFRSRCCLEESSVALYNDPTGRSQKLIPIMIEPCTPPGLFAPLLHIRLYELDEEQAVRELAKRVLGENKTGEHRAKPARNSSRSPYPGNSNNTVARSNAAPSNGKAAMSNAESHDADAEGFLKGIEFNDVKDISVCALTGGMTVRAVVSHLKRSSPPSDNRRVPLRILLRLPELSDKKRANDALAIVEDLKTLPKWLQPEVRYYAAPAVLRSIVIEHERQLYSQFLSFYDWKHPSGEPSRGTHSDYVQIAKHSPPIPSLEMHMSWFDHYWGRKKIRVLVFDFDDTLFSTSKARIDAWIKAINLSLRDKLISKNDLRGQVRNAVASNKLDGFVTNLFFEKQEDEDMFQEVFSASLGKDKKRRFVERRKELRKHNTVEEAKKITNITANLLKLRDDYQLVIVSGTSETLIRAVLNSNGMENIFSFVIGGEVPALPWDAIERKTQNLLRVSTILGIQLGRAVFIGDSKTDYRSALQLGMPFIENRTNADALGLSSLIGENEAGERLVITGMGGADQLPALLDRIEANTDQRGDPIRKRAIPIA